MWDTAAYAFGSYYKALRKKSDKAEPLYDCEFTGRLGAVGNSLEMCRGGRL